MIGPSSVFSGGLMRKKFGQSSTPSTKKKTKEEEQAETIKGAAGRFGRAATTKAKTGESAVEHLQRFGREELAKQEEKKRQKAKGVEPSKGFVERMMERFRSKKKNGE